jgi:RHS repeat-associated protein
MKRIFIFSFFLVNSFVALNCAYAQPNGDPFASCPLVYTLSINGSGSMCSNATGLTLTLSGSDYWGVWYQLKVNGYNTGPAILGNGYPLNWYNQTAGGTYSIVATWPELDCSTNMSGTPTINPLPIPFNLNLTGNGTICSGSSGATLTLSGSQTGVSYQLRLNQPPPGGPPGSPNNGFPPNVTNNPKVGTGGILTWTGQTGQGTYTVLATNYSTGCYQLMTGSPSLTVNPSPTQFAVTMSGGGTICSGDVGVTITLAGSQTGINYQLKSNGANSGAVKAGTNGSLTWPSISPPTGTYIYTIEATNTCVQTMAGSPTLTVNPLPSLYEVSGGGSFCSGGTGVPVSLLGSQPTQSGVSVFYQLKTNNINIGAPLSGNSYGTALAWPPQTTAGSYTVVATRLGCTQTMTNAATVVVNPLPTQFNLSISGSLAICSGSTGVAFTLSGSQTGVSYQLRLNAPPPGGPPGEPNNGFPPEIVNNPKSGNGSELTWSGQGTQGTYTVLATNTTTSCRLLMDGNPSLTVNPSPTQFAVSSDNVRCQGATAIHLNGSESGVGYRLMRDGNNANGEFPTNGTGSPLNWGIQTGAGTYTVTATNSTTNCIRVMSGNVIVSATDNAVVTGSTTICSGDTGATISVTGSSIGVNYQLKFNGIASGPMLAGTGSTLSWPSQTTEGTYSISATNTATGCTYTLNTTALVSVDPILTLYPIDGGGLYCEGGSGVSVKLKGSEANTSGQAVFYQLKVNGVDSGSPLVGNGSELTWHNLTTTGTYTITAKRASCTQTMSGSVTVSSSPIPTLFNVNGGGSVCTNESSPTVTLDGSQINTRYQLKLNGSDSGVIQEGTGSPLSWTFQTGLGTYTVVASDASGGCTLAMNGNAMVTGGAKCDIVSKLAFQYKYDVKRRMIGKKIPGADWVYMVYDNRDRLVMTQDAEQRKVKKWRYIKYDEFNRPILSGLYTHSEIVDQRGMSLLINPTNFYETFSSDTLNNHYTNTVFPTSNVEVMHVTFYDNYDFNDLLNNSLYKYKSDELTDQYKFDDEGNSFPGTLEQATATKIKNLGQNGYLWTVNYFDDKYQIIQSVSGNIRGGIDRITHSYDFVGKILQSKTVHNEGVHAVTITETFEYDPAGRVLKTWHKINNDPDVLIAKNEYNILGQLITKKLHNKDLPSTPDAQRQFKQHEDYRYNIRGWLTRMNNSDLRKEDYSNEPKDYFGMNLHYNDVNTSLGNKPAFNGNISAMKWSNLALGSTATTPGIEIIETKERAYTFNYDTLSRLKSASHHTLTTEWNASTAFHEKNLTYDLNGNIRSLGRTDATGGATDQLAYDYSGNQLLKVTDTGDKTKGFTDAPSPENDYAYDANGNMNLDRNKSITAITYNHLNLPDKVTKSTGDYIKYTYDASGRKLSQGVYNTSNVLKKKTDYVGEFFYENDTLKFINHAEGRIVMKGTAPEYQYNLKDHLGNVRLTFTAEGETITDKATYETANEADEQSKFLRYSNAKLVNSSLFDHTNDPPGGGWGMASGNAERLNGSDNEKYGLAKSLSVMPGDVIKAEVYAKYIDVAGIDDQSVEGQNLLNLMSQISLGAAGVVIDGTGYTSSTSSFTYGGLVNTSESSTGEPKAFLNWIVFNLDYHMLDGGFVQITSDGATVGSEDGHHARLEMEDILIREPGYVYIYLSNENPTPVEVFFDDFKVEHVKSPIIQTDDYYPFGLTFNNYSRENSLRNDHLYNGKELQGELNLNWLDYGARMYMADIGRWGTIDPLGEKYGRWSPYNYAIDNPMRFIDPNGMEVQRYEGEAAQNLFRYLQVTDKRPKTDPDEKKKKTVSTPQDATSGSRVQDAKARVDHINKEVERANYWNKFIDAGDQVTDVAEVAHQFLPTNLQYKPKVFALNKTLGRIGNVFNFVQVINSGAEGGLGPATGAAIQWGLEARGYTGPMLAFQLMLLLGEAQAPEEAARLYSESRETYKTAVYYDKKGWYKLRDQYLEKAIQQENSARNMAAELMKK